MSDFDDINQDVWLPFQRAYAALDIDMFAAFHASDFTRVETSSRWIGNLASYRQRTEHGFSKARSQGDALAIDFRFTDRLVGDDLAYEQGIYRVTVTNPAREEQHIYGTFRSVHRKTIDGWRLLVDHDDEEDGTVGVADFDAARSIVD